MLKSDEKKKVTIIMAHEFEIFPLLNFLKDLLFNKKIIPPHPSISSEKYFFFLSQIPSYRTSILHSLFLLFLLLGIKPLNLE